MDENPFGNRLVHVWSKEPVKGGMLENARVQHVGGREFIVGELLTKDSRNGLTMWMAMEDVLALVEYPDRLYDSGATPTGVCLPNIPAIDYR